MSFCWSRTNGVIRPHVHPCNCVEMGKWIVCFNEEKIMLLITYTFMLPIPPATISSSTDHISNGSLIINQNCISYLFSVLWLELYIIRYHAIQHTLQHSPTGIVCHTEHSAPSFNKHTIKDRAHLLDRQSSFNTIHHFDIRFAFNTMNHSCN